MSDDTSSVTPTPDTSSHVEHLRLVHVTLIAVCLITVITTTFQQSSSAGRAYEQVNILLKIAARWQSGVWLKNFVAVQRANLSTNTGVIFPNTIVIDELREDMGNGTKRLEVTLDNHWRLAGINEAKGITDLMGVSYDLYLSDASEMSGFQFTAPTKPVKTNPTYYGGNDLGNLAMSIIIWNRLHRFQDLYLITQIIGGWHLFKDPISWQVQVITARQKFNENATRKKRQMMMMDFFLGGICCDY